MNVFEKAIYFLAERRIDMPTLYGWFHLAWLGITLFACALIFALRHKITQRQTDITLIVWGVCLILLEILKQFVVSFGCVDGKAEWNYAWWAFPFQFCSMPLYLAIPAGALPDGKVKGALKAFLASYALLGGAAAMIYPANMFTTTAFISVHTMLWHSSMVAVCFMLLATRAVKPSFKSMAGAVILFLVLTLIALILNIAIGEGVGVKDVHLFFISPYEAWKVPVISTVYNAVPYPVFLMLFIIAMTAAAAMIMGAAHGLYKLYEHVRESKKDKAA